MESLNIRPAERKDCVSIVGLIRELAIYEKMVDQVLLTPQILERDGFDVNPPLFNCLVAEIGTETPEVVGYALYFQKYSTWEGKGIHLEDFYVSPSFRHRGIGGLLLKKLAQIAVDDGYARLSLECLNWNKSAIDYYKRLNGVDLTETEGWHVFRFHKPILPKLAGYE